MSGGQGVFDTERNDGDFSEMRTYVFWHIDWYEREGMEDFNDKSLSQASHRLASVDEVMGLIRN